jgi:hypothetical protein
MRKLIGILGLASVVAAMVAPVSNASDYRGRYQLRLDQATTVLAPPPPTR